MSRYCGISLYLANSAAQSAAESGGRTPTTGFHSVIDRPERVSRVMPPITTIKKISAQQTNSQVATAPRLPSAAHAVAPSARLRTAVVQVDKRSILSGPNQLGRCALRHAIASLRGVA